MRIFNGGENYGKIKEEQKEGFHSRESSNLSDIDALGSHYDISVRLGCE
jgi:hypothetical protein